MMPFKAIVRSSTVGGLVLQLSNGHIIEAPPHSEFHFGQEVFVCYDRSRNKVGEVRAEFLEEDLFMEPEGRDEVPWEEADETLDMGEVN